MCLILFASSAAVAQWQTRPWPSTPNIKAAFSYRVPAGRIFLSVVTTGRDSVLYRSDDDGQSWRGSPLDTPWSLFAVPATANPEGADGPLYATFIVGGDWWSSYRCELRRSDDVGLTWTVLAPASRGCNVAVDPTSPQVLYAAGVGEAGPAYKARSIDGGATWLELTPQIPWWTSRFKMGSDGAAYAVAGNPFVSRDRGLTFTELTVRQQTGAQVNDLLALRHLVHGDKFVLVATNTGLYKSIDGGVTWLPAGLQGFEVQSLTAVPRPAGSPLQVMLGYRRGVALWTEDSIAPLSNGLPFYLYPYFAGGAGVVSSPAGLSICEVLSSCIGGTLPGAGTLVEFHHSGLDHYFITLEGAEARAVDAGAAGSGWSRTGSAFKVYADSQAAPYTVAPACRYYGTLGIGPNSHVYSVFDAECSFIAKDAGWTLEAVDAFAAIRPSQVQDPATGKYVFGCPNKRPIYRLYNNRAASNDSNHRYVNDPALFEPMRAAGWTLEGISFCEAL